MTPQGTLQPLEWDSAELCSWLRGAEAVGDRAGSGLWGAWLAPSLRHQVVVLLLLGVRTQGLPPSASWSRQGFLRILPLFLCRSLLYTRVLEMPLP